MPDRDGSTTGCVFCAIVGGRAECSRVYEDERFLAFLDINPITPGHLLVVPKLHSAHLQDLPEDLGTGMFTLAQRLAGALRRSGLRCEGINLFLADGEAAFQDIFHVHLHVLPRFLDDSFRIDTDRRSATRAELDDAASQVRDGSLP